jgi:hypothetical protein
MLLGFAQTNLSAADISPSFPMELLSYGSIGVSLSLIELHGQALKDILCLHTCTASSIPFQRRGALDSMAMGVDAGSICFKEGVQSLLPAVQLLGKSKIHSSCFNPVPI